MCISSGTDSRARLIVLVALIGAVAIVPAQCRPPARRAWSFAVYYVGYRVLLVQLSCGALAVSGMPLVAKLVAA